MGAYTTNKHSGRLEWWRTWGGRYLFSVKWAEDPSVAWPLRTWADVKDDGERLKTHYVSFERSLSDKQTIWTLILGALRITFGYINLPPQESSR